MGTPVNIPPPLTRHEYTMLGSSPTRPLPTWAPCCSICHHHVHRHLWTTAQRQFGARDRATGPTGPQLSYPVEEPPAKCSMGSRGCQTHCIFAKKPDWNENGSGTVGVPPNNSSKLQGEETKMRQSLSLMFPWIHSVCIRENIRRGLKIQ